MKTPILDELLRIPTRMFTAIINDPGYLPYDMPVPEFDTADGAKRYLIDMVKDEEDNAETEEAAEDWCAFAEELNLESDEFSTYGPDGVAYSVRKDS